MSGFKFTRGYKENGHSKWASKNVKARLSVTCSRIRTGHGKPGKSWNLRISFSRPGNSWNFIVGP